MKRTSRKKTITETVVEHYKITETVKMIAITTNGELVAVNFFNKGRKKEFSCIPDHKKFREQVKQCNPFYYGYEEHILLNTAELIIDDPKELFKLAEDDKLTDDNFFYLDGACHRIEDVNGDYIDIMVRIEYIGGFSQKSRDCDYKPDWNWEKLKKCLSKCKDVISFEEDEIPYYNSEFDGQKGLSCDVIMRKGWVPKTRYSCDSDILLNMENDYLGVKGCIKK